MPDASGSPDGAGRRNAGVLGRPIAHSLSPALHRAAYAVLGLDWTYTALDCGVADLPGVLAARADWAGFSCTMPLKHAVLDVATEVRPVAVAVGAGNTLLPGPEGWIADNTDVTGIQAALGEHGVTAGGDAVVLGAGGTAQAVLAALAASGFGGCAVLVRDPARTEGVRATAERVGLSVRFATLEDAADVIRAASLVVATLPTGAADAYLQQWTAARPWHPGQTVLDVVYAGWPTALARTAETAGATVVSGALLLLHQAAAQVAAMTGRSAPLDAMRAALRAAAPGGGI